MCDVGVNGGCLAVMRGCWVALQPSRWHAMCGTCIFTLRVYVETAVLRDARMVCVQQARTHAAFMFSHANVPCGYSVWFP